MDQFRFTVKSGSKEFQDSEQPDKVSSSKIYLRCGKKSLTLLLSKKLSNINSWSETDIKI